MSAPVTVGSGEDAINEGLVRLFLDAKREQLPHGDLYIPMFDFLVTLPKNRTIVTLEVDGVKGQFSRDNWEWLSYFGLQHHGRDTFALIRTAEKAPQGGRDETDYKTMTGCFFTGGRWWGIGEHLIRYAHVTAGGGCEKRVLFGSFVDEFPKAPLG